MSPSLKCVICLCTYELHDGTMYFKLREVGNMRLHVSGKVRVL